MFIILGQVIKYLKHILCTWCFFFVQVYVEKLWFFFKFIQSLYLCQYDPANNVDCYTDKSLFLLLILWQRRGVTVSKAKKPSTYHNIVLYCQSHQLLDLTA